MKPFQQLAAFGSATWPHVRTLRPYILMDDEERVGSSKELMFQTGITKSGIHPFLIVRK
jgi:hypothetical protein